MLPGTINMMLTHRNLIKAPIIVSERCDPKTRYDKSKIRKWVMQSYTRKLMGLFSN